MTLKRIWILAGMIALSTALFTACTSSADTMPSPSPSATGTPTTAPMATATQGPTVSIAPALTPEAANNAGVSTVEDAARISDSVSEEVEKLSELDNAEAVVAGSIALVGIEYDGQYQGGLTDRVREMVEERVMMIDRSITTVHVTDDAQTVANIAGLRKKLDDAQMTFEDLQTQVLEIGSGITGGGEAQMAEPSTSTGA